MLEKLEMFNDRNQEFQLLEDYLKNRTHGQEPLSILEAGCGRAWPLKLSGISYRLTGVDIDEKALNARKIIVKDLDDSIIGDLRTLDIQDRKYDVVYSSYVLEHITHAERALENMTRWLKPGGLLILRIPDRDSVYGFITRITPFWVHVFYKKYVKKIKHAGEEGFGPYPTVHDHIISRNGIHEFCKRNGLVIKEEYGKASYLNGKGIVPILSRAFAIAVSAMSLGKLRWEHNNLTYIIVKPESAP
ncbi:hypothetical protein CKO25_20705 [Thiocapsa imhoffii]|uniref:Methyltransferase type 11 domain-containing protein n=1 Tax=Thiocapsa imhoffii TaxID=382777 RepID=A0A9X1BBY9_9GAMM|nr:class I SAM-dependent methyltransferase [Thiocapsa imhoffii]MBK1646986.1 hypothetical protein [Thiocapsa imhoffii]